MKVFGRTFSAEELEGLTGKDKTRYTRRKDRLAKQLSSLKLNRWKKRAGPLDLAQFKTYGRTFTEEEIESLVGQPKVAYEKKHKKLKKPLAKFERAAGNARKALNHGEDFDSSSTRSYRTAGSHSSYDRTTLVTVATGDTDGDVTFVTAK